jgi:formylglycine-generating enzyme required for sulfatase activity
MSGNAWEWCLTKWRGDYSTPADDRPEGDGARVVRGGSFLFNVRRVRCAVRYNDNPGSRGDFGAFRVVVSPSHP